MVSQTVRKMLDLLQTSLNRKLQSTEPSCWCIVTCCVLVDRANIRRYIECILPLVHCRFSGPRSATSHYSFLWQVGDNTSPLWLYIYYNRYCFLWQAGKPVFHTCKPVFYIQPFEKIRLCHRSSPLLSYALSHRQVQVGCPRREDDLV
jgi:hypothetical protein